MGAFIAKQPNGLYCRFSTTTDCPTTWNLTEEQYIELCMQKAKEIAQDTLKYHLHDFEEVKQRFQPNNMTRKEFSRFLKATKEGNNGTDHDS